MELSSSSEQQGGPLNLLRTHFGRLNIWIRQSCVLEDELARSATAKAHLGFSTLEAFEAKRVASSKFILRCPNVFIEKQQLQ